MSSIFDALAVLLLVSETALLVYIDRKSYNLWLSPFTVLAVPFLVVALLALALAEPVGFIPMSSSVWLLWAVGLFIFWLAGAAVALPFSRHVRRARRQGSLLRYERQSYWPIMALAWLCILLMTAGIVRAFAATGLGGLGSDVFRAIVGTGLFGHTSVLSSVIVIYLIGATNLRRPRNWITIGAILIMAVIYGVKGWLIIPIVSGMFYRIMTDRLRVTLRLAFFTVVLGIVLFFAVYLLRTAASDVTLLLDPTTYTDLARHFGKYLFAGVLGLTKMLDMGVQNLYLGGPETIFAPFVNLINLAFGTGAPFVPIINQNYVSIAPFVDEPSNVPTLFGTLLLFLGPAGMLLYGIVLSLIVHVFFLVALIRRNCWVLVTYTYLAGMLAMSWFEMYFWHLNTIEVPLLTIGLFVYILTVGWLGARSHPTGQIGAPAPQTLAGDQPSSVSRTIGVVPAGKP